MAIVAPGRWRIGFDLARAVFRASHVASCPDVAPECATTSIPDHEHHVSQTVTHSELNVHYGLRQGAQLSLRLPWDHKDVHVGYTTLTGAPFQPPYGDIHHRSEKLSGVSDATLTLDWSPAPDWIIGAGTTLPIGGIEEDPIELGRRGVQHQHIQFGSGTFQPKLSLQWSRPGRVPLSAWAEGRFSLYENDEGFRAPTTAVWSAGPSFRVKTLTIAPRLTGQYQAIGRWNGEVDEGSGFHNAGIRLGVTMPVGSLAITPSVYREIYSHGFHDETFRQETSWSVAITRQF